mmetsp:Transcript_10095/g.29860  ORF Transcript_10095/g.29860 Transcript_10095/m.29860 type:complete len:192 (-) Transcript_10095:67-642(-)
MARLVASVVAPLLLLQLPAVHCSPHMLNGPDNEHSSHHKEEAHHHAGKHHKKKEHQSWAQRFVAMNAADAREAEQKEAQIFENGRKMRERRAAFYKELEACRKGDVQCERRIIKEHVQKERMLAVEKRMGKSVETGGDLKVKDAMGRPMQLLFSDPTKPILQSGGTSTKPAAAGTALLLALACAAGAGMGF